MYCPKCGSQNRDEAKFCAACGGILTPQPGVSPPQQRYQTAQSAQQPRNASQPFPQQQQAYAPMAQVKDYLVHNIIVTVFGALCCLPALVLGIIGIVNASNSRNAAAGGDYYAAQAASDKAKTMFNISLVLVIIGVFIAVLYIASMFYIGAKGGGGV